MAIAIQSVRRSVLSKTQTLIQFLQIQHQFQKPFSCSSNFLSSGSSTQSQTRNFGNGASEMRKSAFEDNLIRILRNEIRYELDGSPLPQPPAQFSGFKVEERPGEQWISLGKKFGKSEEIKVEVTMFDGSVPLTREGDKPGLPGEEVQLHITMIVSIFKEEPNQVLEFICSAWPDTLEVKKLFVRGKNLLPFSKPYTGPVFGELDDELQNSLYDFLEERGIDDHLCEFLHKYIHYKDKAEYIRWMESLRSAVEKK